MPAVKTNTPTRKTNPNHKPRAGGVGGGLRASSSAPAREHIADIQRARILGAVVEVVAVYGAANVTVAHIVARSGVSRRTFYELFSDREDCFLAAFEETIGRIAAVVVPAYERPSRWSEKIRAGLIALLEILDSDRAAARLVIVDALAAGANALERRRRVLARVIDAVEQGHAIKSTGHEVKGREVKGHEVSGREGPPSMVAEGVVGGVLAVLHSRLLEGSATGIPPVSRVVRDPGAEGASFGKEDSLLQLAGPLMSMIVLPYLGAGASRKELARPVPERHTKPRTGSADPLRDLDMRLTYRTVRVLMAVAELGQSGSYPSNREVGMAAGMTDQGQTSKLLSRLHRLGLIQNTGIAPNKGTPNAWKLTPKGTQIEHTLTEQNTTTQHTR